MITEKANLWTEVIVDGKSSITIHEPKMIKQFCKEEDHYWEISDNSKRLMKCKHCGMENHFVVGVEEIRDGKIVKIH